MRVMPLRIEEPSSPVSFLLVGGTLMGVDLASSRLLGTNDFSYQPLG